MCVSSYFILTICHCIIVRCAINIIQINITEPVTLFLTLQLHDNFLRDEVESSATPDEPARKQINNVTNTNKN